MTQIPKFETVLLECHDGIAELKLNRPHVLNAIDPSMLRELGEALDIVESDAAVHVLVVSGEGRAFSAGFDLKASAARGETSAEEWRAILEQDFAAIMRFWDCPKPTIAAVHGHCIGGGFEIALACDITIAAESSLMGEPEVRFGSGIVALLLPWITGPKQAKEILLAGRDRITARQACDWNMINRVVADGDHVAAAKALAEEIVTAAPSSVRLTKRAINRSYDLMGMRQALLHALETDVFIESTGGPERKEFNRIRSEKGLGAALSWRDGRGRHTSQG